MAPLNVGGPARHVALLTREFDKKPAIRAPTSSTPTPPRPGPWDAWDVVGGDAQEDSAEARAEAGADARADAPADGEVAARAEARTKARSRARSALGLDPDDLVVGIVGRLVPIKNHELLFDAVPHLLERLKDRTREKGIDDRVRWLGWRKDLSDIYPALDVLALPSKDEGSPVAIIEALAAAASRSVNERFGLDRLLRDLESICLEELERAH